MKLDLSENKEFGRSITFYERYVKRPLDFFCALVAIIVLSPVMLVIALLVRIKLGSPVIFKQKRPGRTKKYLLCINFEQ